jgi:hypothetical protein
MVCGSIDIESNLFVFRNKHKKDLAVLPVSCYFPAIERASTDSEIAELGYFPAWSSAKNPRGNAACFS